MRSHDVNFGIMWFDIREMNQLILSNYSMGDQNKFNECELFGRYEPLQGSFIFIP